MSISPELSQRLHKTLLRCGPFDSNAALYTNFTDGRIAAWRDRVPDSAYNRAERVSALIDALHDQYNTRGDNVLVLFLHVLHEHIPSDDCCYQELANLAYELEREFELHSPQPEVPETFGHKVVQFVFGDIEAQRAHRNRMAMLRRVHKLWVDGLLRPSLHDSPLIDIRMEFYPEAVDCSLSREIPMLSDKALPKGTRIIDVFDEMNGSLLILGEPGSGKTTMLLTLARDVIAHAEKDPTRTIPVVFNLSSWAEKRQPLAEWLIEKLNTIYHIPKKVAYSWIENNDLLLLLDGLDEVAPDSQDACVKAINRFHQEYGLTYLVVCSRLCDYKTLTTKVNLQGAVLLQPLTQEQIDHYLENARHDLQAIYSILQQDQDKQTLVFSPLLLNVIVSAYEELSSETLYALNTIEAQYQYLFDIYIKRMFDRRTIEQPRERVKTLTWLSWLSREMLQHSETLFFIEAIQPSWLSTNIQRNHYVLTYLCISSLLPFALWVATFLILTIAATILGPSRIVISASPSKGYEIIAAPFFGALAGLLTLRQKFGLRFGLEKIIMVETLKWSWYEGLKGFISGSRNRMVFVGVLGLIGWLMEQNQVYPLALRLSLAAGIGLYFVIGFVNGLQNALSYQEMNTKTIPNQGIRLSFRNSALILLLVMSSIVLVLALAGSIIDGWDIISLLGIIGLVIGSNYLGPIFWLKYGGLSCIQHFSLRLILRHEGHIPWYLMRFLDYCVDRIFLRRVGGGYIFIHRLLQEHFAVLTPEDIKRIAGDSRATV